MRTTWIRENAQNFVETNDVIKDGVLEKRVKVNKQGGGGGLVRNGD